MVKSLWFNWVERVIGMYFNITVPQPEHLQACHEEADTLIVLHVTGISAKNIIVRASDTNGLVILVGVFSEYP